MHFTRRSWIASSAAFVSGCSLFRPPERIWPEVEEKSVSHIHVSKKDRLMRLEVSGETVREYRVALGFTPEGHKEERGDGRTPEGEYRIAIRNPRSQFHLSLGISYPSADDIARAAKLGRDPGGDIFIHGHPNDPRASIEGDWTAGCIAVTNEEMREIWRLVPLRCPIVIEA